MHDDEFLRHYDASRFPRPSVAVDMTVLTVAGGHLYALLMRRDEPPQQGLWSLPGGFVGIGESLDDAAQRVLRDKTGLEGVYSEQLYTFGDPGRDPRTRIIAVAYVALVAAEQLADHTLARLRVPWEGETGGPVEALGEAGAALELAFDHGAILGTAVKRLRGKLDYAPIGFQLLPLRFTLRQLQAIHETILGRQLNKPSFRRRMLASGQLEATGTLEQGTHFRPAELYRYLQRPDLERSVEP